MCVYVCVCTLYLCLCMCVRLCVYIHTHTQEFSKGNPEFQLPASEQAGADDRHATAHPPTSSSSKLRPTEIYFFDGKRSVL